MKNVDESLHAYGELTPEQVREIRERRNRGETCKALAKEFNLTTCSVSHIATRRTYKDVE